ncbi:hypothetical protein F442_07291 [Phytophthora nicotianae P10297]|uniref:Uncharacterized protein n=1 Tax=Phytophthora nicotianae P10297 TaxID=1317064 RepID=W2ZGN0_PHYNI|nr:hypothetical protein F442_07291 [Phytophthora nicotianae P10297]
MRYADLVCALVSDQAIPCPLHQSPADPKLWHCATYVNDTCLRLPCSDPPGRWRNGRTATQRIGTCSIHVLKASAPAIRTNGAQLGLQHA